MDQESVKKTVQGSCRPLFETVTVVGPFNQYITETYIAFTGRERSVTNRREDGIKLKAKGFATKRVQLDHKHLGPVFRKKTHEKFAALFLGLLNGPTGITGGEVLEILIHPQARELKKANSRRHPGHRRASHDKLYLMAFSQGPADLKASVKMADTQDVLTIKGNSHGDRFSALMLRGPRR